MINFLRRLKDWLIHAIPMQEQHGVTPWRPKPQEIVEPISEGKYCEHCNCIKRGHPCCWCGVWMKDVEPIDVAGIMVTLNPIAMEIGKRYGFSLGGPNEPRRWAMRYADETVEITTEKEEPCTAVETVVEDCRNSDGWLSEDVICHIRYEPRCEYHRSIYK